MKIKRSEAKMIVNYMMKIHVCCNPLGRRARARRATSVHYDILRGSGGLRFTTTLLNLSYNH